MNIKKWTVGAVIAALFAMNQTEAKPIVMEEAWQNLPEQAVSSEDRGRTLIFSDSPEMAQESGILYRDSVTGKARVFLYHVNDTAQPKRIVCLLTNKTDEVADVRVSRMAGAEPSEDWLAVGRDTQKEYFAKAKTDRIFLAPRETRVLTRSLEKRAIRPNELVHTIHDFETNRQVEVTVMIAPLYGNLERFARRGRVLEADASHLRGTFEGADRYLTSEPIALKAKAGVQITLADNNIDRYKWGIDATDGEKVLNYGNYGVVYHIDLPIASGRADVYLNPQGGLYAGGVLTNHKGKIQMVATPGNRRGYFGVDTTRDGQKIGTFDETDGVHIKFSPPGASNLPVKLIIIGKK